MRDPLAPLVRYLIAPAWARWERSPYLKYCRQFRRTQYYAPESIRQWQWHALVQIVDHAYRTTDFYRRRFDDARFRPESLLHPHDLLAIPLLTKDNLRREQEAMVSAAYRGHKLRHQRTSGSTGVSVEVLVDEPAMQIKRALTLRSNEWSGWQLGERAAAVWGNPEYLKRGLRGQFRNLLLERTRSLDTLKMDVAAMRQFADSLRRHPPSLLFGHAHSLYLFSRFCGEDGGAGFVPKGIISSAMVLHSWERQGIEQVFRCPVTNRYGCEEVSLIACQCERHGGLHINADGIFLEVIRADGSPCRPGEVGAIVVTDLLNRAMPMIRYRIGDMGALVERPCSCGRGLPLLDRIEGRVADYVVTSAGELISGISLTENLATLVPGVAQLQIVQTAVDRFVFRIVRTADWGPPDEDRLAALVAERFGNNVRYACEFVDRIPQEPSGKYRFCISKVPHPFK